MSKIEKKVEGKQVALTALKGSALSERLSDEMISLESAQEGMSQETKDHIDTLMSYPLWWGYLHVNGTVQVKRFFDNRDLHEAHQSTFVQAVCTPIPCVDRATALITFTKKLAPQGVEQK